MALDRTGPTSFVASATEARHVFGGLLVAQALRAAHLTLPRAAPAHALHSAFVRAADGTAPIGYDVECTRDGASFATRRVMARQAGTPVFVLTAHFHDEEEGAEYALPPSPGIPEPDGLPVGRYDSPWFESRDVPVDAAPPSPPNARRAWFRARSPLPDDPVLHQHALAYLSDHGPTRAAREPHAALSADEHRMSVSLDHSVWFHRPGRVDRWLLYELVPVATGAGRGLALGTIREADGTLLATVAQEVLLRARR